MKSQTTLTQHKIKYWIDTKNERGDSDKSFTILGALYELIFFIFYPNRYYAGSPYQMSREKIYDLLSTYSRSWL